MERKIKLYDIVTVKKDYVFKQPNGTMHCKKGKLGRLIDIHQNERTGEVYYGVEFFDKFEIDDPVFFFLKDELELVQTSDEEMADYLKEHPEYLDDEKWLRDNEVNINKIKEIWKEEKHDGKGN